MEADGITQPNVESPPVMVLARLWLTRMKMNFGVERHLTAKEFGQLKMLRRFLGHVTSQVIDMTLDNWRGFCSKARIEAGLLCTPAIPHIGFLLTHNDTARRFCTQLISDEEAVNKRRELIAQHQPLPPEGHYFDYRGVPRPIPETSEEKAAREAEQAFIRKDILATLGELRKARLKVEST